MVRLTPTSGARAWSLRVYFALLFALVLGGSIAGALYVDHEASNTARRDARQDALFSAKTAAGQLESHVALLKSSAAGLAANPQIARVLDHPEGCTLSFQGFGGTDKGHLDIIRADGTVACSSRPLAADPPGAGYGKSTWLSRALRQPTFVAPVRDDVVGVQVAVAASPIAGAKGAVVAFADLGALGPSLASLYGGGRPTVFLVTTADSRTVVARSIAPAKWIGKNIPVRFANPEPGSEWRDLEGGVTRLYSHALSGKAGWNVYVGEDKAAVLASVTQLRNRQLGLIAVGLLFLLLAASLIYRKVASPIRRLSGAVRSAREEAAPEPVPVSGPSEVRALAEDVNALTAEVQRELRERREANEALRRSDARYRDLFENASDLIVVCDLDGRMTAVNQTCLRATGYSAEELIGMHMDDVLAPESREQSLAAREQQLAGDEAPVYESELVAKDGHRLQIEIASRLIVENGVPVGTEAICRDISYRKQLEEQLRQAQRLEAIGRLAGGVAHDFNNLLTVISGYAEALLEGRDRAAEPELDQIAAAAERAAILTRQLLAFSRRQVLQPQVFQLNDVVDGLTPMLSRLIGENVELVATLGASLDPVLADPNQLEQVLVNLAINARDAMPEGGLLTISTANVELDSEHVAQHADAIVGHHVMLSVSDTGVGMDVETLSHVFEPFFTTKPVGIGTGLGLATVYGIVKQSGGSLWVYSEPGQGTTFKAFLPRAESPATEVEKARAPKPVAARGTETILLAEDEESLRRLTARILEQRGYKVIAAETATEALRVAEQNGRTIDLLLTDLIMPELSGTALAERICKLTPAIRVLFMSGYADEVVSRNGALTPGSSFLEKPFSANDLAAKVRETLDAA